MHLTHGTLRGLTLHLRPAAPVFAGEPALLDVVLTNPGAARYGIGAALRGRRRARPQPWPGPTCRHRARPASHVSLRAGAARPARGADADAPRRAFPLGLFRAWTVWRPAARVLVYPRPEPRAAAAARAACRRPTTQRRASGAGGEFDGVRAYRRGDPLQQVVWKKVARSRRAGQPRHQRQRAAHELWLDWAAGHGRRRRGSACRAWPPGCWPPSAPAPHYGLRLPGRELAPGQGDAHRRRRLEALALWA